MPGKVYKLIKKPTTTTDEAHHQVAAAAAAAPKPYSLLNILLRYDHEKKMWLVIGPAQRAAEKAAKAKSKEEARSKSEQEEAPKVKDHSTFESKLGATKRKLHDSYQQLANAKKKRTIQVIDPSDLSPSTQPSSQRSGTVQSRACSKASTVVAARKKMMITTNRKTRNNNNNNNNLMKPTTSS